MNLPAFNRQALDESDDGDAEVQSEGMRSCPLQSFSPFGCELYHFLFEKSGHIHSNFFVFMVGHVQNCALHFMKVFCMQCIDLMLLSHL